MLLQSHNVSGLFLIRYTEKILTFMTMYWETTYENLRDQRCLPIVILYSTVTDNSYTIENQTFSMNGIMGHNGMNYYK